MDKSVHIYKKLSKPFFQAVLSLGGVIAIILFAKSIHLLALADIPPLFYWKTSAALLFFFVIMNTLFSLSAKERNKYWRDSIYSLAALAVAGAFMAYWASSLSIYEASSYHSIYIVIMVAYLVFSSIASMVKKLAAYAENEKWDHPRVSKKNKK